MQSFDTLLVDTDVLIWASRGRHEAIDWLNSIGKPLISAVTYMEMVQGLRNKAEHRAFLKFITAKRYEILTINDNVTRHAMSLMDTYVLSHGMQMADALIASTAIVHDVTLTSGNLKDYRFIADLSFQPFMI